MDFTDPSLAPPETSFSERAVEAKGKWTGCAVLVLILIMLLALIAWDFMPVFTLGARGKTIERELLSGMSLTDAENLLRSRGLRFKLIRATTGTVTWRFDGLPVVLTTGTTVFHVYLLPHNLNYTEKALLKLADHLPQDTDERIRNYLDSRDLERGRRGTPTSHSYAVTSGTIERRLH